MSDSTTTYLITGAGSGIGDALARRLAARGSAGLWFLVRSEARAAELGGRFPGARAVVADLGEPESLAAALAEQELPARLDALVHSAGVVELGPVAETDPKVWAETMAVNLVGPAELTRLLLPRLRAARGHVVFVNSGAGLSAGRGWGAYGASKHGLKALADALRAEEAGGGVRVTTVYPGRTATPMQAKVHRQEGREYEPGRWIDPESVATTLLTALDLPRDAQLTDVSVRPGP
ncbi:SDR family oxidoreductase [Streptomyces sp. WMMC500]|uniref:SDR family oxidoreductase n=1 Tax=Streptomyces sp. WMMC500 TaxID=3015154 RepID=UPI00248D291C|nr:SDR family oxidoreductase [Streptomyces sp. WMMC500]WBB62873.1 SDR family oxidoreductase [Streptomyces sp. WMMC500]